MSQELEVRQEINSLSLIENANIGSMQNSIQKIKQFQGLVQAQFTQDHDFGIIPGTKKPTLLKPGAEKLIMLLGLTSEFEIIDSTRDWDGGFFQYQILCKLLKHGQVITEGMGSCNTKENKYVKGDPFTLDNTVLKMAKKRALIDAALLVGSLSDVFTQDIEDMDLNGEQVSGQKRYYTDQDGTISKAQAKRLYAIAQADSDLCKSVMSKYGYNHSDEIKKIDYEKICSEVEAIKASEK